jgi:hypothetical protein
MFWPRLGPESGGITITVNGTHLDKVSRVSILVKHPVDSAQLYTAQARWSVNPILSPSSNSDLTPSPNPNPMHCTLQLQYQTLAVTLNDIR